MTRIGCLAKLLLKTELDTKQLASSLADEAAAGDVICLYGNLGAGKSSFARAFIRTLTSEHEVVPSPTYTLIQTYEIIKSGKAIDIFHADLYRISDLSEVGELGLDEAFETGISLIEWPECAASILPDNRLEIYLDFGNKADQRVVCLYGEVKWKPILDTLKELAA